VTPSVNGLVATYDVAAVGSFKFFAFGLTGTTGTNYYDSIVVNLFTPADEAAAYASAFLSATETCSTSASGAWSGLKTAFQALSSDAQAVLVAVTYDAAGYATNTDIQKCAQRYDLAVSRQSLENFMSRAPISAVQFVNVTNNSTTGSIIAIVIISIVSLSALSLVVLKKKNKHE
jgi:DNA-binding transcriptional regulator YbjK